MTLITIICSNAGIKSGYSCSQVSVAMTSIHGILRGKENGQGECFLNIIIKRISGPG